MMDGFFDLGDDLAMVDFFINALESNAGYTVAHSDRVGDGGDVPVLRQERRVEIIKTAVKLLNDFGREKIRERGREADSIGG